MSGSILNLDFIETLRGDFPELAAIGHDQCCECMNKCKDTKKYMTLRENVDRNDDLDYLNLADQIINLCTHRTELEGRTLACLLRDKYLKIRN